MSHKVPLVLILEAKRSKLLPFIFSRPVKKLCSKIHITGLHFIGGFSDCFEVS